MNLTDEELLLRYKATGDLSLWGDLFLRYNSLIYGVCLKYLKDRDLAKDAVMQLFEKLAVTLKTHEVSQFKSWLYVTGRNYCLMQLRSEKGRKKVEISEILMESDIMVHREEEFELEQNLTKLEKCLNELSAEQKECVRMFFLQEKCYKEITNHTGFDHNKVKSFIQNGKRNLKICMEKNG